MDEEEGGNGSAGSGHSLSLLGSDEDLENQLPFDHADSDGSDLRSPNDSEEEAEELPMEQEASMMEEVRALIEYAMPSELGASPFQLGVAAPPHPIPAQAVDHHAGSYLAKAALLLPVAMDLYTVDRDPEVAKSRFSLPRAMCVLLSLLILLTCGAMHVVFEVYSGSMRHEILETANDAISLQSSAVDGMMYNQVTSERLKHVLGSVSKNLSDTILRPADQAVESLSAFLRSRHALNRSWDASRKEDQAEILYRIFVEFDTQWKIQDGPFRHDHVVASDAAPTNQLKSLSIISTSGHVLGMEGSSYTVSCPRSGPAVCGHCIGECKDLDVNAFTSQGQELVRRKVDVTSGLPVGRPLLEEPFNFSESPAFAAQEAAREAAGLLQKRWSKIYHRPEQAARLSWTAPIASCGSYACLKGVVAAEVVLDHLDELCRQSLPLMAQNGSIFVVNHVSPDAAQHGMLLAAAPHAEEVAATSRALMAKFKAWNADPLSSPQVLSFRKSKALKGQFVECGAHLITASEDDCLQAATASLELDPFMRWLLVAVLPETPRLTQSALAAIDLGEQSVNEARISSTVIVVLVGFIALLVGRVLAWSVTEPMLQLSLNFQQVDRFDGLLPDAEVLPKSFAIKDVSDVQQAFRKFLSGIRAFSRFIPEDVVTRIIFGDPRSVRPHVDSRSVTIMFTGIRDIIRMSFNEEQLLSVITRFHKTMTAIVEQYEGAVGEILDEGLLVYFNAPRRLVDHPVKACEAALAQRKAMAELRNELVEDGWLDPSDSCLRLGVGIHTGNVLVGCIGSTMKMKFGCIGDAMNLASRLKGICKYYDVDVMCSEETYLATTSLVCRKIDDLQVKGRAETTAVYEVMGPEQATGGILSPEASPQGPKPAPEVIGAGALTLPIQLGRKKGPPQFLTPEERGPPVLLTQLSRSPRSYPDSPVVMGRQIHSPDRTTRTTAGDRTTRTTGASWSAGASPWPAPSPESGGSEGYSRRHGRGCSSSSMSPAALEEVTTEQRALKKETEAALEAYQQSNPEKCVKICRKVLMSNPDDTVTRRLLEKALQHPGFPEITVMDEK